MIKVSLLIATIFLQSPVFASGVKITNFRFLNNSTSYSAAAELCGVLVAPSGKPEMIKIISDPASKGPGNYIVWTGKDGKFCSVIASYTGQAEVDLE